MKPLLSRLSEIPLLIHMIAVCPQLVGTVLLDNRNFRDFGVDSFPRVQGEGIWVAFVGPYFCVAKFDLNHPVAVLEELAGGGVLEDGVLNDAVGSRRDLYHLVGT